MGLSEFLTIIFVICKLFGVITWSWWLVFLPEIIAVAPYIAIWMRCIVGAVIAEKRIDKMLK